MLTDDDLTRDLRGAFQDATDTLLYDGLAPTVRRTPAWASRGWLALPVAAAAATVAVVVGGPQAAVAPVADPPSSTPPVPADTTAASPSIPAPPLELVTERFQVAGFTVAYQRPADQAPMTLHVFRPGSLPDGARPLDLPGTPPERAWIGTDRRSGDGALYLRATTPKGPKWTAVVSPGVSADELGALLTSETGS
ncbi:hypothetical protein [Nocardioides sp. W7]|uniref:hypothetical protein n=1 Tax=Nocardioides sp. W7 TaxID=2931390 RepID=UPI001FCFE33B|nr:hypothetical protein [Nocardioides sp. W7]